MGPSIFDLLESTGPVREDRARLAACGQFVGAWDLDGTWRPPDGRTRTGKREWHFDWIYGGRGILDVLFASGVGPHEYGITLRCYDRQIDAWRLAWMQPASGEFVNLIGRSVGDTVVAETCEGEPSRRWSFTDITPDSFVWRGEVSSDNGATWSLEQEMKAGRRRP